MISCSRPPSQESIRQQIASSTQLEIEYNRIGRASRIVIDNRATISKIAQFIEYEGHFVLDASKSSVDEFFEIECDQHSKIIVVSNGIWVSRGKDVYSARLRSRDGESSAILNFLIDTFRQANPNGGNSEQYPIESLSRVMNGHFRRQRNVGDHMSLSADGKFLFAVDGHRRAILSFRRRDHGKITFVRSFYTPSGITTNHLYIPQERLNAPTFVVASTDGKHVYVCSKTDNAIVCFPTHPTRGIADGIVCEIQDSDLTLVEPESIAVSPVSRSVYITSVSMGEIWTCKRNDDGSLQFVDSAKLDFGKRQISDSEETNEVSRTSHIIVSPDGKFVYVTECRSGMLACFQRNADDETLALTEQIHDDDTTLDRGLSEVSAIAITSDGKAAFTSSLSTGVSIWNRNVQNGSLTFVERVDNRSLGIKKGLGGACALAIRADGKRLYVASRYDDSVCVFEVATEFKLRLLEVVKQGDRFAYDGEDPGKIKYLSNPRALAIARDGKRLYVGTSKRTVFEFATTRLDSGNSQQRIQEAILAGDGDGDGDGDGEEED